MRFAFIQAEKAGFPVSALCRALGVSRPGFYAWQTRPEPGRVREDRGLAVEVAAIHAESHRCYGSPRVHAELRARGRRTSRKRVARLMRCGGLSGRRRSHFRTTTDSTHGLRPAQNILARQFAAAAPNRRWVTDITFISTHEGWVYLAAILDLFSRRVVGWAMSDRLTTPLALEALTTALAQRAAGARSAPPFGSGCAVRQRGVSRAAGPPRRRGQHESPGRLLGQRGGGELLCDPQSRIRARPALGDASPGAARDFRLHRILLQSEPAPFIARLPQSDCLRASMAPSDTPNGLTMCLQNRGKPTLRRRRPTSQSRAPRRLGSGHF